MAVSVTVIGQRAPVTIEFSRSSPGHRDGGSVSPATRLEAPPPRPGPGSHTVLNCQ